MPERDEREIPTHEDPDIAVLQSGNRWTATIRSEDGFVTIESDSREEAIAYAHVAKHLFQRDEPSQTDDCTRTKETES